MFKFYRSVLLAGVVTFGLTACGDDVTITDPPGPPAPGVTSVTVAPSTATVAVGQSVVFAASVIADNGVSTAVTWTSSNPLIATVDGTGKVTGVSAGTTTIIATSSSDNGKTGIGTITVAGVGGGSPAQISIQSITKGGFNTPVQLNNVNGQIEVNLNFNPGGQQVDSVKVFIGGKAAATQRFASNAAAGILSMSVNTANFTKNVAAGTTTVDFFNGPSTITATAYLAGGSTTSTQGTQIVLNNTSGFAANVTRPTQTAIAVPLSSAIGQTFWGGPTAAGLTTVTLFPVLYESGRLINSVTFGFGGCPTVVDATLPFTQSFGYTAGGATVNCATKTTAPTFAGYEWTGGMRDNVVIVSAIDNGSNAFLANSLIPNTVVFGSTPDSLRIDYKAPASVTAPLILGTEGFNWLNNNATLRDSLAAVSDFGVGGSIASYVIFVGPSIGSTTVYPITFTNVAALPETNTNCALPTPGCDGYAARATATDLLGNTANSAVAATFGVDRTLPVVRYGSGTSIFASGDTTGTTDSTFRNVYAGLYGVDVGTAGFDLTDYLSAAPGTGDSLRVAAIDNRAGLSRTIIASRVFKQGGVLATGATTNTGCQTTTGGFGAALFDGYRPTTSVAVTCGATTAGYYTTTFSVVDRAGNVSSTIRRTVVIDPNPPQVTGVSPNAIYVGNDSIRFTIGVQDDLEVIDARLRVRYGNLLLGDGTTTPSTALVFNFGFSSAGFGTRFDSSIINPFLGSLTLDRFTVSIQETCTGAAAPYAACRFRGDPVDTVSQPIVKPDSVAVIVRDVYGSFVDNIQPWNIPMRQTGVSAEFASPILSATVPAGSRYSVTYDASTICLAGGTLNGPCVQAGINWRNFGGTGSTRTFRATQDNSTTLPIFTRVDLFGLNAAGEWRYIQRITVPAIVPTNSVIPAGAGTILGTDNGGERYWDYSFTNVSVTGFTQFRALGVNATGAGLFSARQP